MENQSDTNIDQPAPENNSSRFPRFRALTARLQTVFRRRKYLLAFSSFIGTLVFGAIVFEGNKCLMTEKSPKGLWSVIFNYSHADEIRSHWETTTCDRHTDVAQAPSILADAKANLVWDFLFAISYTSFFLFLVFLVPAFAKSKTNPSKLTQIAPPGPRARLQLLLVFILFVVDITENFFLLFYFNGAVDASPLFMVIFWLKIAAFAAIVSYLLFFKGILRALSFYFHNIFGYLWVNRVSVFTLLALYLILWKSDQGQDLLVTMNSRARSVILFLAATFVLATLNWFLPRYYSSANYNRKGNRRTIKIFGVSFDFSPKIVTGDWDTLSLREREIPRIFGVLTFLIPACGILNALKAMHVSYMLDFIPPGVLLLATTAMFAFVIHNKLIEKVFAWFGVDNMAKTYRILLLATTLIAIFLAVKGRGQLNSLHYIVLELFALAVIFTMFCTARRSLDLGRESSWYHGPLFTTAVLGSGAGVAAIFVVLNIYPENSVMAALALPVAMSGIVFYEMIFWFLVCFGKFTKFNWAAFIIAIAFVIPFIFGNRFHDLRRVDTQVKYKNVLAFTDYADQWVESRRDAIMAHSSGEYPVFLVNTYGGGIRAAAWTSFVISHLESQSQYKFQDHVFSYSGASGGTIGASVMCAVRSAGNAEKFNVDRIKMFYENDFLTPVVIGLLGRDALFSIVNFFDSEDRSRIQDRIWADKLKEFDGGLYESEYTSLWYRGEKPRFDVPLLFSNTSQVELGLKAYMAPVRMDTAISLLSIDIREKLQDNSIAFSTGAFLSARFPYISPAGKLDQGNHFLDGGIKENSGAETSYEIFQRLTKVQSWKKKDSEAWGKIKFYFISIDNRPDSEVEPAENLIQALAPISAVYNSGFGNAVRADSLLRRTYSRTHQYFRIIPTDTTVTCGGEDFQPILPLGWQISNCALLRLKASLHSKDNERKFGNLVELVK
jgi:hypothetical protein